MPDNRFPSPGVDARFPSPGTDVRFATPGIDAEQLLIGTDTRFEGTVYGGGDPNFSNVSLLAHFDGTNGSTTFTDVRGKALTAVGNVQISTAQSKFGGASGLFDGTGDKITTPDSADFDLGAGAFTVELFARLSTKTTAQAFINQYDDFSYPASSFVFYQNSSGFLTLRFCVGAVLNEVSFAWAPTLGVWYHLCAERNASGRVRIYVDGVMLVGANGFTGTINNSALIVSIGCFDYNAFYATLDYNGHMDELRITKGVARYDNDAGFTVPIAAFLDA